MLKITEKSARAGGLNNYLVNHVDDLIDLRTNMLLATGWRTSPRSGTCGQRSLKLRLLEPPDGESYEGQSVDCRSHYGQDRGYGLSHVHGDGYVIQLVG